MNPANASYSLDHTNPQLPVVIKVDSVTRSLGAIRDKNDSTVLLDAISDPQRVQKGVFFTGNGKAVRI